MDDYAKGLFVDSVPEPTIHDLLCKRRNYSHYEETQAELDETDSPYSVDQYGILWRRFRLDEAF